MERSFVIKEVDGDLFSTAWKVKAITETELRRRLQMILNEYGAEVTMAGVNWEWSCDILLHGKPKQKDEWEEWLADIPLGLGSYTEHWKMWFRKMVKLLIALESTREGK